MTKWFQVGSERVLVVDGRVVSSPDVHGTNYFNGRPWTETRQAAENRGLLVLELPRLVTPAEMNEPE